MNGLFFLAISAVFLASSLAVNNVSYSKVVPAPRDLSDLIDGIVQGKITALKEKLSDPIQLDTPISLEIPDNPLITGTITVSDVVITGVKAFTLPTYTTTSPKTTLHFKLILDTLTVEFKYHNLLELGPDAPGPITNDGSALIKLNGIALVGTSGITLIPLGVKDLQAFLTLSGAEFKITGLLNDEVVSAAISELLTENVAKLINLYEMEISPPLSQIVQQIFNQVMSS